MAVNGTKCNIAFEELDDLRTCIEDLRRIEEELHELVEISHVYGGLETPINRIDDAADEIELVLWTDFMNAETFMERRFGEDVEE